MQKFIGRWGPVLLWAGIIFTLSSIPTFPRVPVIWWDFILKKSAHVIEYAIFYWLLRRALPQYPILALIIGILYALSDEFHQSFVPGRTAKLTDVGFDTIGILVSWSIIKKHGRSTTTRQS